MKMTMPESLFNLLVNQLDGSFRPDYSGRGMYGATCLAYEPDEESGSSIAQAQFEIAAMLADIDSEDDPDSVIEAIRDKLAEIGTPSQDSMGLGAIYYWRGIQVEGHVRESKYA